MTHPLTELIEASDHFLLIGDSREDRFPAASYASYTSVGKPFYCLDLGGLTKSRGLKRGGPVFGSVEDLPDTVGDLAVIWVKPSSSVSAVEVAHQVGCTKVWFSFKTAHPDALVKARELGMEVVEVGRCPVYFMKDKAFLCKLHTLGVRLTGLLTPPPHTEVDRSRRELL